MKETTQKITKPQNLITIPEPKPPRVYACNLAAYVAGHSIGEWVTLSSDVEAMESAIGAATKRAEEWIFCDFDHCANLGEFASVETLAIYAKLREEDETFFEHFASVWEYCEREVGGDMEEIVEAVECARDRYLGAFDSFREFSDEEADRILEMELPDFQESSLKHYFNYDAYERDQRCSGLHVIESNGKTLVFHP